MGGRGAEVPKVMKQNDAPGFQQGARHGSGHPKQCSVGRPAADYIRY